MMKFLKRKLWAKIVAYILFVAAAAVVAACVPTLDVMFDQGYFLDDWESRYSEWLTGRAKVHGEELVHSDLSYACISFLQNPDLNTFESELDSDLGNYKTPGYSNLIFTITDPKTGTVLAGSYSPKNPIAQTTETVNLTIWLDGVESSAVAELLKTGMGVSDRQDWLLNLLLEATATENGTQNSLPAMLKTKVTLFSAVDADFPVHDSWYVSNKAHRILASLTGSIFYIMPICAVLALILLCFLIAAAGHRANADGVVLSPLDRLPFDLFLVIASALWAVPVLFAFEFLTSETYAIYAIAAALAILLVPVLCMSLATRVKAHCLWKNTLIYKAAALFRRYWRSLWHGFISLCHKLPLFIKSLLIYGAICAIELICLIGAYRARELYLIWFICRLVLAGLLIAVVLNLQALKRGAKELSSGNLSYKIPTKYMFWEFKNHAEQLNNIGDGLQKAVEARLKDERLKTELITNVSHDIKTPLTSIINYVDLLKKEPLNNETAQGYLEILDRQSSRLKKLTEDLVEASKADTGNIPVHLEKTDVSVLLEQVVGEYEERLAAKNLQIVPDIRSKAQIMADGRLLQRILENLLGNVCKYALENTRVYLTCEDDGTEVQISLKNISKYPLNITAEELTERFVRGDTSRNTEGSGLGLSIAKSLSKLQNAQLNIFIDGDLFKAMIRFKIVK